MCAGDSATLQHFAMPFEYKESYCLPILSKLNFVYQKDGGIKRLPFLHH